MADSLQMCMKFIIFNFYSKYINVFLLQNDLGKLRNLLKLLGVNLSH